MMIFKLIINELVKLFAKLKTWVVFLVMLVFIIISFYPTYSTFKNEIGDVNIFEIDAAKQSIAMYNKVLSENNKLPEDEREMKKEDVKRFSDLKVELEKYVNNNDSEGIWKYYRDNNIKDLEEKVASIEKVGITDKNKDEYLVSKQSLELSKKAKETNLRPLLEPEELGGYSFIFSVISDLGSILLIILIAVFMSDIVSGEASPATIKTLLVQPVGRGKVLIAKFVAATTTILIMIIGLEVITLVTVNLITKNNYDIYPTIINKLYNFKVNEQGIKEIIAISGSGEITTNVDVLIQSLILQVLFIISVCSVVFMISVLTKNSMISMALSITILAFGTMILISVPALRGFSQYLFVCYGDSYNLITGDIAQMYGNLNMSIKNGVIAMGIPIIFSYVIAHISFCKKDILG